MVRHFEEGGSVDSLKFLNGVVVLFLGDQRTRS